MDKQCLGCGHPLQDQDKNQVGYVKNKDQDFCVSCFRLKHYGDLSKVNQLKVDPYVTLEKITKLDALNIWVVDLFHLEESKINSLHRWLNDKPVVLMVTKRELLPQTMSNNKIKQALLPFIKESHLNVIDVLITGKFGKMNKETNIERINELKVETKKDKVVFFGNTNVGKSTLINELSDEKSLSVSALPGTTLDLVEVKGPIENLYDSAGIAIQEGVLEKLSHDKVHSLQNKKIKPITLQLKDNQSLIIDGFGYLSFFKEGSYSVTCYLPENVLIHRTKQIQAQAQYERISAEFNELKDEKLISRPLKLNWPTTDIILFHLGFITVHDSSVKVESYFKESVLVQVRKALL